MSVYKGRAAVLGVAVVASVMALGGGASAATTPPEPRAAAATPAPNSITGAMVKDGTLYSSDIAPAVVAWFTAGPVNNSVNSSTVKDGALNLVDFSAAAKAGLKGDKGDTGGQGLKGDKGDQGLKGDTGDTGAAGTNGTNGTNGKDFVWSGKHWGSVLRNTLGSGSADLKATSTTAPSGDGALEINTASPTDKASYGNEVDFLGQDVSAITKVGYSVYTTGENNGRAAGNMPSITFEIDPNLAAFPTKNYASMVFAPNNSTANVWTAIDATDDAQGKVWGLTGTGMPCSINGARCTWSELQAALNDGDGAPATVLTLAVGKGRDYEFHGAVDNLVYNTATFDFEPTGVK